MKNSVNKALIFLVVSCTLFSLPILTEKSLHFSEKDVELSSEIIGILENNHYSKKKYDSVKEEALKEFIERIDPNKSIFLEKEVISYLEEEKLLSPYDQKNSLENAYKIFHLYQSRYQDRYDLQKKLLSEIKLMDLKQDRKILKDRSKIKRPNTLESVTQLWEDNLVNDVIQLSLNGNNLDETGNKIIKKINNQFNYFKQTKSEDVLDLYFNSIARSYGPHSDYMSPKRVEDFDIGMKLSLEGIGALLTSDGLYTTIASLVPGGPAEKSNKLKPNDKIVGVAQSKEETITDVIGWRIDDVVRLIRGPKETKVQLEIIPSTSLDDSQTKVIEITRGIVNLEDQAAEKRIINIQNENAELKVGVIELPAFYMDFDAYQKRQYNYRSSSKDVKKLIHSMKEEGIDGLIIDLRNNGGGSLMEANSLAHLFLGGGVKVQVKTSSGSIHGLGERRGYQFYDGPLVVLVNQFSASASEILAGAVQDYNRGLVLGTDTFGKGTVQKVEDVSRGKIKFTESKFYRVSGKSTQNKGVSPDVYLPSPIDTDEFGEEKLPGALKYDIVAETKVKNFRRIKFSKEELALKHKIRTKKSILFNHYKTLKEWRKAQKEELFLDLNIDKRKVKKEKAEFELLTIQNDTRTKLGLSVFDSYQAFLDREENPDEPDIDDEILFEAANVLSDFIVHSYKPIVSMNKAS